jgi:aryl-alcohol dehydrogenase-like predicted oxidoreductase
VKYRNLGASGVKVSELCLGGMTFGDADEQSFMHKVGMDDATSRAVMNRAVDLGINFIDTADVYGQDGLSERVMGEWFSRDGRRNEIVLATKFRLTMGAGPNRSGASRYRIRQCVEASLKRLKTDRIDLYQIHMQDIETPEEETLRALDDLVTQGKVLYVGCSNYAAYRLQDSLWLSQTQNLAKYVTLQAEYSLVTRDIERELIPLCRTRGVGILSWSPLAGGFLSGKYRRDEPRPTGARLEKWQERWARFDNERCWSVLSAVRSVASDLGSTEAAVALAWVLAQPCVSSAIFGARSLQQLEANVQASELALTPEQLGTLTTAAAFELGYPYTFLRNAQGRW